MKIPEFPDEIFAKFKDFLIIFGICEVSIQDSEKFFLTVQIETLKLSLRRKVGVPLEDAYGREAFRRATLLGNL